MGIDLRAVYADAWRIYRLLLRRSLVTAAIVFAFIETLDALSELPDDRATRSILGLVVFALILAGPVFVQGALVEIVRNIHEGRRPEEIPELYRRAWRRLGSLVWASIVYGLGVMLGLVLLIVPGLVVAARWCLMAPLIMLEGLPASFARARSSEVIRGRTARVLLIVVATFLLIDGPGVMAGLTLPNNRISQHVGAFIWSSLTAPFGAHILTVVYYRLTDPARPVVHEDVERWASVWNEVA